MVASWKGFQGEKEDNKNPESKKREFVKWKGVKIDNQNLDQPKWWRAGLIDN